MNSLEEFFKQKVASHDGRTQGVNWEGRKEKWIAALNQLYEMIST